MINGHLVGEYLQRMASALEGIDASLKTLVASQAKAAASIGPLSDRVYDEESANRRINLTWEWNRPIRDLQTALALKATNYIESTQLGFRDLNELICLDKLAPNLTKWNLKKPSPPEWLRPKAEDARAVADAFDPAQVDWLARFKPGTRPYVRALQQLQKCGHKVGMPDQEVGGAAIHSASLAESKEYQ